MAQIKYKFFLLLVTLCAVSLCNGDAVKDGKADFPVSAPTAHMLPAWLGDTFATSESEHFLVAHDAGPAEAQLLAHQLECAFGHFQLFFEQFGYTLPQPQARLTWIGFSDPDYFSQYARRADRMDLSMLKGYYSARTNRVAIIDSPTDRIAPPPPVRTVQTVATDGEIAAIAGAEGDSQFVKMAHELAHQLAFNTGLQKRGVMYPLWVSEGLATQYETQLTYCRGSNLARSDRLDHMRAADRLIPLAEFVSITRLPAEQWRCEDLYAQAWGWFHYLLKQRPDQLKHYLETLYYTRPGTRTTEALQQEFVDSFGPLERIEADWIASMTDR